MSWINFIFHLCQSIFLLEVISYSYGFSIYKSFMFNFFNFWPFWRYDASRRRISCSSKFLLFLLYYYIIYMICTVVFMCYQCHFMDTFKLTLWSVYLYVADITEFYNFVFIVVSICPSHCLCVVLHYLHIYLSSLYLYFA